MFGDLLHTFREHGAEGIYVLSSSNIQIPYHCEFNIQYHGSDPNHFHSEFLSRCRLWCEVSRKTWMFTEMPAAYSSYGRTANVHTGIKLYCFSLGCMTDRWTFVEHYKQTSPVHHDLVDKNDEDDKSTTLDFEHDSRFFTISFHCPASQSGLFQDDALVEYKLRVRYDDLQELLLVDYPQQGNPLTLFFMLKAPPTFHRIERHDDRKVISARIRVTRTCCISTDVIGNSSVLSISVADASCRKFQGVISRFRTMKFRVYWSHIDAVCPPPSSTLPQFGNDYDMTYTLQCLLSQGFCITDRTSGLFAFLNNLSSRDYPAAQKALQQLSLQVDPTLEGDRFIDLANQFQTNFEAARDNSEDIEDDVYSGCKSVRRAIVTPTRCLLLPAELMSENRVLRRYGEEFCMRVVFRDETFSKLSSFETSQADEITQRVVDVLSSGIHVGPRCYDFLACSNSQLRDHGCWLYAQDLKGNRASDIRAWMGTFSNITCVATYVARMGQCFSTSEESVKVTVAAGQVKVEEDIKSPDGKYVFSDGIGRVSPSLAAQVRQHYVSASCLS